MGSVSRGSVRRPRHTGGVPRQVCTSRDAAGSMDLVHRGSPTVICRHDHRPHYPVQIQAHICQTLSRPGNPPACSQAEVLASTLMASRDLSRGVCDVKVDGFEAGGVRNRRRTPYREINHAHDPSHPTMFPVPTSPRESAFHFRAGARREQPQGVAVRSRQKKNNYRSPGHSTRALVLIAVRSTLNPSPPPPLRASSGLPSAPFALCLRSWLFFRCPGSVTRPPASSLPRASASVPRVPL